MVPARSSARPTRATAPPFLYHHYTGHDNNRDWYMFTQAETRLTLEHVYDRWHPQIVHDLHQMGATRRADLRAALRRSLGAQRGPRAHARRSTRSARTWRRGSRPRARRRRGRRDLRRLDARPAPIPHTHGGVRILTETASAQIATPIEVKLEELEARHRLRPAKRSWNFPAPWPGGTWRLADIVGYQLPARSRCWSTRPRTASTGCATFSP